ncbi:hypothetical protein OAB57_03865, partial [Bacteriovoracaceae bacterium]|nr:hypothetical protein [Bacteriovoracaceae bacterium]
PSVTMYELGGTAGYYFVPFFYAGLSGHTQKLEQQSTPNSTYGNRSSLKWAVLPTLGFTFEYFINIHIKYQFEILSQMTLDKKTSSNQEVTYKKAMGHRLTAQVGIPFVPYLYAGFFAELSEYEEEETGSTTLEISGNNSLEIMNFGVTVSAIF